MCIKNIVFNFQDIVFFFLQINFLSDLINSSRVIYWSLTLFSIDLQVFGRTEKEQQMWFKKRDHNKYSFTVTFFKFGD